MSLSTLSSAYEILSDDSRDDLLETIYETANRMKIITELLLSKAPDNNGERILELTTLKSINERLQLSLKQLGDIEQGHRIIPYLSDFYNSGFLEISPELINHEYDIKAQVPTKLHTAFPKMVLPLRNVSDSIQLHKAIAAGSIGGVAAGSIGGVAAGSIGGAAGSIGGVAAGSIGGVYPGIASSVLGSSALKLLLSKSRVESEEELNQEKQYFLGKKTEKTPNRISNEKLKLDQPLSYYQGKENQIIQEVKNKNIEPERWEKLIDILTLLEESQEAKNFLKKLLLPPYTHEYWEPALDSNLVSIKGNKIMNSLTRQVIITSSKDKSSTERENAITLIQEVLNEGTIEAKLACVRLINSFSDILLDRRLFQPLLNFLSLCNTDKSEWAAFIKRVIQYFIDSSNRREDGSYDITFSSNVT